MEDWVDFFQYTHPHDRRGFLHESIDIDRVNGRNPRSKPAWWAKIAKSQAEVTLCSLKLLAL
jgi:hypothetical protein